MSGRGERGGCDDYIRVVPGTKLTFVVYLFEQDLRRSRLAHTTLHGELQHVLSPDVEFVARVNPQEIPACL